MPDLVPRTVSTIDPLVITDTGVLNLLALDSIKKRVVRTIYQTNFLKGTHSGAADTSALFSVNPFQHQNYPKIGK